MDPRSDFDSNSRIHHKLGNTVHHLYPTWFSQIKANDKVHKDYQGSQRRRNLAKNFDHRLVLHSDYNDDLAAYSNMFSLKGATRDR